MDYGFSLSPQLYEREPSQLMVERRAQEVAETYDPDPVLLFATLQDIASDSQRLWEQDAQRADIAAQRADLLRPEGATEGFRYDAWDRVMTDVAVQLGKLSFEEDRLERGSGDKVQPDRLAALAPDLSYHDVLVLFQGQRVSVTRRNPGQAPITVFQNSRKYNTQRPDSVIGRLGYFTSMQCAAYTPQRNVDFWCPVDTQVVPDDSPNTGFFRRQPRAVTTTAHVHMLDSETLEPLVDIEVLDKSADS